MRISIALVVLCLAVILSATLGQEKTPPESEKAPGRKAKSASPTTKWREAPGLAVTYEQLKSASDHTGNWLTYSGQYHSQRFSQLDQIDKGNVANLRVKWVRQFKTFELVECSPLVVDGLMFVTLPENKAAALDAKTGLPYWLYDHPLPDKLAVCCGKVNRGFAVLGDTLYLGTLDAQLVALDARTGNVRWKKQVIDHKTGHSITGAPLIVKDMVITGIAGGEYGIRGFLDAYDAKTGERRWRHYTIPGPGEKGHETWAGDSWQRGGSPAWMTGSFDAELNLLYWGTGNPGPDWNGEVREGDNLYSNCILALDPDSGEMKWHFQFTPHDVHDWDACQVPVLVDLPYQGRDRKLMLFANRNGFYYVLDRQTGEFLHATPFAKQTWAKGIDPKTGRPIEDPTKLPTPEGNVVWPDISGAANWWSPSYSPRTKLFYQMSFDGWTKYYINREVEYRPGLPYLGGFGSPVHEFEQFPSSDVVSAVRALDPLTGKQKWQYPVQVKSMAGLLSTAGGLVFSGTKGGVFFALDAETGQELWRLDLGAVIHAAPVTYEVNGQQFITIAAGNAFFTLGL